MSTAAQFQNPGSSPDQLAPDPNVTVPRHVTEAAERAAAIHAEAYRVQEPAAPAAPEPAAQQAPAPEPVQTQPAPTTNDLPAPAQQQAPQPDGNEQGVSAEEWRHRFLSMQGRFNAAQKTIGSMEEQMRQLGVELVRTQQMLAQPQAHSSVTAPTSSNHGNLITDEDRSNYGDDLIDLTRRAAMEAVGPEIESLRAENQNLKRQVGTTSKRELFMELDRSLPDWRRINTSVQFKTWLRLPNVYTNRVRQEMLNEAVDGAKAPQVLALFKDFLAEQGATGQQVQPQSVEQVHPPRVPAVQLETLAAPGRARPASGENQVPADKPYYTRAGISKFFDEKRRGLWAGRETEAQRIENDLSLAQREGRIQG